MIYCESCGESLRGALSVPVGAILTDERTYDSDQYPKGPFPDGGGESDFPHHCDDCHEFLENPLTTDGYTYLHECVCDAVLTGRVTDVLRGWIEFYEVTLGDILDFAKKRDQP